MEVGAYRSFSALIGLIPIPKALGFPVFLLELVERDHEVVKDELEDNYAVSFQLTENSILDSLKNRGRHTDEGEYAAPIPSAAQKCCVFPEGPSGCLSFFTIPHMGCHSTGMLQSTTILAWNSAHGL